MDLMDLKNHSPISLRSASKCSESKYVLSINPWPCIMLSPMLVLAALLLEQGEAVGAEAVYREDLHNRCIIDYTTCMHNR